MRHTAADCFDFRLRYRRATPPSFIRRRRRLRAMAFADSHATSAYDMPLLFAIHTLRR